MSLKNKVAVVTGGSSGIGASVARKFTSKGATVVIVGRNLKKLEDVSKKCEELGKKPLIIVADVTKDDDLKRIVTQTISHFGRLDILVNNAGVGGLTHITNEDAINVFDKLIATNLRSAVALTSYASPYLIETKGNIVNISSIASTTVFTTLGFAYNTSKAALDHFTRCAAKELSEGGVRVNVINPGPVKTDIVKNSGVDDAALEAKVWESMRRGTALGRISDPDEIADLVFFLASDTGRGITGASILVDNGVLLKSKS